MNLIPYIGIPYANHGRGPSAYDCWGLIRKVYADLQGIELDALTDDYSDSENPRQTAKATIREITRAWEKVEEPRPFDVVVFCMGRLPSHAAIYLGKDRFLHTLMGRESCVERLSESLWKPRVEGYYRYRGEQEC